MPSGVVQRLIHKQLRPLCKERGGNGTTNLSDARLSLLARQDFSEGVTKFN